MTVCRLQSLVFLWFPTHNFSMYNEQVITVLLLYHFSGKGKGLLEANPQVGMASISEGSKDKSQHNPSRFVLIHIAFYSTCLDDKKKKNNHTSSKNRNRIPKQRGDWQMPKDALMCMGTILIPQSTLLSEQQLSQCWNYLKFYIYRINRLHHTVHMYCSVYQVWFAVYTAIWWLTSFAVTCLILWYNNNTDVTISKCVQKYQI